MQPIWRKVYLILFVCFSISVAFANAEDSAYPYPRNFIEITNDNNQTIVSDENIKSMLMIRRNPVGKVEATKLSNMLANQKYPLKNNVKNANKYIKDIQNGHKIKDFDVIIFQDVRKDDNEGSEKIVESQRDEYIAIIYTFNKKLDNGGTSFNSCIMATLGDDKCYFTSGLVADSDFHNMNVEEGNMNEPTCESGDLSKC